MITQEQSVESYQVLLCLRTVSGWSVKQMTTRGRSRGNGSPAAATSLKSGGEERPSRRKEGWEEGTEGAGVGVGPPGRGRGRATLWAFSLLLFLFLFFFNTMPRFTFTAGVDTQVRCIQRKSYHLMRDPPAGLAALLRLKLA